MLFLRFSSSAGAVSIRCVPCVTSGGTTRAAKSPTKAITATKMTATAPARDSPRRRIASTAGLRPVAKKSATRINTNTPEALASARIMTNAVRAPTVATKPK